MQVTTVGIDLAKLVFQIHGVNAHGKTVLRKALQRKQVAEFFAGLPPCLIEQLLDQQYAHHHCSWKRRPPSALPARPRRRRLNLGNQRVEIHMLFKLAQHVPPSLSSRASRS